MFLVIYQVQLNSDLFFRYALKYFEINPIPPFEVFIHHEDSYNVAPKKRRLQESRQKISHLDMVRCCYYLLRRLPNELSSKWDWTKFIANFSNNENVEIRWYNFCLTDFRSFGHSLLKTIQFTILLKMRYYVCQNTLYKEVL